MASNPDDRTTDDDSQLPLANQSSSAKQRPSANQGPSANQDQTRPALPVTSSLANSSEPNSSAEPADLLAPTVSQAPVRDSQHFSLAEGVAQPSAITHLAPGHLLDGRYRLVEVIGSGGMGSVWRAVQAHPVQREVAVKLIKIGFANSVALTRFDLERQSLALMNHPHIAAIYDSGVTRDGHPWFAMELVQGKPVTDYADQHRLSITERLNLFLDICHALHHAHQKGIIHRDIKPSNVLVSTQDGRPVAKVIDFGLAKAFGEVDLASSLETGAGIVGTPHYMSPEQATFGCRDIDIRTDVYSLGVVLYELLTGSHPFRSPEHSLELYELLRQIRETDPMRPSLRVQNSDSRLTISDRRRSDASRLTYQLRKELDWIVLKALEKDRERRYTTAHDLAGDIQRYLQGEPVIAHPPSRSYRIRKFLTRYRGPSIAAALLLASLTAGIVGTTWGMQKARRETVRAEEQTELARQETSEKNRALQESETLREQAEAAQKTAETAQKATAQKARELARIVDFQSVQIATVDARQMGTQLRERVLANYRDRLGAWSLPPAEQTRRTGEVAAALSEVNFTDVAVSALETQILDQALAALERDLPDQPSVQAALLFSTAQTFERLGRFARAIEIHRQCWELRRKLLGDLDPLTLNSKQALAYAYESNFQFAEAETLCREICEVAPNVLPKGDPGIEYSYVNLASVLNSQGKYDEAEGWLDLALACRSNRSDEKAEQIVIAQNLNNQGTLATNRDDYVEGERYFREALKIMEMYTGAQSPQTLAIVANLANAVDRQGQWEEAAELYERAWRAARAEYGDRHVLTLKQANAMGVVLWRDGEFDQAIDVFESVERNSEGLLEPDHPSRIKSLLNLAINYREAGRYESAINLLERLFQLPLSASVAQTCRDEWVEDHILFRRVAPVADWLAAEVSRLRQSAPPNRAALAGQLAFNAMAMMRMGEWKLADPLVTESCEIRQEIAPQSWTTFNALSMHGEVKWQLGDFAAAEPLLIQGVEGILQATFPADLIADGQARMRKDEAVQRLIKFYESQGNAEAANLWRLRLDE